MSNITMPREVVAPSGYPEPLTNFQEGQWWVKELDAMAENASDDQKRAVAVVHHLLLSALSAAAEPGKPKCTCACDAEIGLCTKPCNRDLARPAPAVPGDLTAIRKHNETIPAAMYPSDPKPEERFARQVIAAYPDHAMPDAVEPEQQAQEPEVAGTLHVDRANGGVSFRLSPSWKVVFGESELITLQSHCEAMHDLTIWYEKTIDKNREAIAKKDAEIERHMQEVDASRDAIDLKDAALAACVGALENIKDDYAAHDGTRWDIDAAIAQAEEAGK